MLRLMMALALAGLVTGCGRSSDKEPAASGGEGASAEAQSTESAPAADTGGKAAPGARPNRGILNVTRNDLDRIKERQQKQIDDIEKDK
jgi:hypothetical protein